MTNQLEGQSDLHERVESLERQLSQCIAVLCDTMPRLAKSLELIDGRLRELELLVERRHHTRHVDRSADLYSFSIEEVRALQKLSQSPMRR